MSRHRVAVLGAGIGGMATAVLSVGEYTLAPEDTGRFIADSYAAWKASGEDIAVQPEAPAPAKVPDLMAALEASIASAKTPAKKSAKKPAAKKKKEPAKA